MAGEDDMELVAIFRAEDEATPVIESMRDQFTSLDRAAADGFEATGRGAGGALGHVRGLHRGLGGLATVLRLTGQEGAAHMVHLAGSLLRVGGLLRSIQAAGGISGMLGGVGGLSALGGPVGLALLGGLAVGGIAGAALSGAFDKKEGSKSIVNVSVDARGTVTEHRALADEVARQVEASLSSRSRFAGAD